jgi:hypothetical protein
VRCGEPPSTLVDQRFPRQPLVGRLHRELDMQCLTFVAQRLQRCADRAGAQSLPQGMSARQDLCFGGIAVL